MSYRTRIKKAHVREHRRQQLDKALDLVLAGKAPPAYMTERAKKLKELRR